MTAPPTLTVSDTQKLLDALLAKNARHKTFLKGIRNYLIGSLMLEAGLRVGEVVQLRLNDLYFGDNPVTSIVVRAEISKSKEERSVPVSDKLRVALEEYASPSSSVASSSQSLYAFQSAGSFNHITTRQVERIINATALKAIGRPVNPHMLRHTFATKINRVTDMPTLQELLGHKNLSSTQIYMHPNEEDKKNAIEKASEHTRCDHPQHLGLASCPDLTDNANTRNANRNMT